MEGSDHFPKAALQDHGLLLHGNILRNLGRDRRYDSFMILRRGQWMERCHGTAIRGTVSENLGIDGWFDSFMTLRPRQ